jgi:T4-like virus tail tube protein gp19
VPGEAKQVHGNIHVKLQGVPGAESGLLFNTFSPPDLSLDAPEFRTWDAQGAPIPSLGAGRQAKVGSITLSRGLDDNQDLMTWFNEVKEKGATADTKKDLTAEILTADGTTLKTWNITGAVITSYRQGDFDANGTGILVETVTIECEDAKPE